MGSYKAITVAVLTGLLFIGFNSAAFSQERGNPPEKSKFEDKSNIQNKRLEMMRERLKLSDGQVNEIKAIMETARLKAEKDREKFMEARDREGARKAAEARQKEIQDKIRAVLNDKQKKEYDKMLKEMREQREKRRDTREQKPGGKKGRGDGNWR